METLFLKVLSMSATAAVVILVVLLAQLLLRKAPKVFSYALWAVVLFRLLCPFTIQNPWSLTPSIQVEPAGEGLDMVEINMERVEVVIRVDDSPAGRPGSIPSNVPAGPSVHPDDAVQAPGLLAAVSIVWLIGAVLLLGYSALSLLRLRRKLVGSVPLEGERNVRLADHIPSPFVLGLFRPNIYLPSDLPEGERDYVLLHERTHIRRCDHLFRALAWLALAIHWINPLVWLAFHLAGKDMEMSCDETVLRKMGRDVRADYSTSLLRLSTGKRLPAGPLAFGAGDPTSRIKNVLSYKKPALWVVVIALIGVLCAGVALATDRGRGPDDGTELAFTLMQLDAGRPYVRMEGTVLGHTLGEHTVWWPPYGSGEAPYVAYRGLMMEYTFEGKGNRAFAWWTDESRTSVTVSTEASTIAISALVDWWEFTVDLSGGQGVVTSMETNGREGALGDPFMTIPEVISDEEAVEAARIAAKLLTAAEDWYLRQPAQPADFVANLTFSLDERDEVGPVVRMDGTVGDVTLTRGAFWRKEAVWIDNPLGELSMVYPPFSDGIEGHVTAWWTDEGRRLVTLSTHMTAMLSSYLPTGYWIFTVDVDSGTVIEMTPSNLTTIVGDENAEVRLYPTSISNAEAVKAARVAATLLTAAEDYYNNVPVQADAPDFPVLAGGDVWMEVLPGTVTPAGLTYMIHNETPSELMYGEPFGLQVKENGEWCALETKNLMAFPSVGYILKGNASASKTIGWSYGYGELSPGHYRVTTKVHLEPGREAVTLSAEFEIEA